MGIPGSARLLAIAVGSAVLCACVANGVRPADTTAVVTGTAAPASGQAEVQPLVRCARPFGSAALLEPDTGYYAQTGLTSPLPLIRQLMAQSGCFQVVDRSAVPARERTPGEGGTGDGMAASGSSGAADYIITPRILRAGKDLGGGGGLGALLSGMTTSARDTPPAVRVSLTVTNVRTGVQDASAEGSATDYSGSASGVVSGIAGAGGVYERTDLGRITAVAFLDAHNNLVNRMGAVPPGAAQEDEAVTYLIRSKVNFRSGPATSAPIIGSLAARTPVRPTGTTQGDWWQVEANGVTGWVHSRFISH